LKKGPDTQVPIFSQGHQNSGPGQSHSQTNDIHIQCGIRNLNGVGFQVTGNAKI
jgi:hypothetical protein